MGEFKRQELPVVVKEDENQFFINNPTTPKSLYFSRLLVCRGCSVMCTSSCLEALLAGGQ
jgi:hypothetical protein